MHPTDPSRELSHRLQGLNIYLVGMMASGKSSVGPALASALGYRFIDADAVLEKAAGCTIPELFQRDGEQGFRALERQVLQQIASWHSLVVATGGGVVSQPANWGELHQGVVVWLNVAEAELRRRLQADPGQRPLLAGAEGEQRLGQLLEQRKPLYAQADLEIEASAATPQQLAQQIIEALPSRLKVRSAPPATAP